MKNCRPQLQRWANDIGCSFYDLKIRYLIVFIKLIAYGVINAKAFERAFGARFALASWIGITGNEKPYRARADTVKPPGSYFAYRFGS